MNSFIEFFQNVSCLIQAKMLSLLGEEWIANVISLIMGILGTIAFFMQIPKKIKPVVIQYGDIIFNIEGKNSHNRQWITLTGIELFISVSNLRNAVGILEDIFVRVYTTDSYNPEIAIYYVTRRTIDGNEDNFTPFILNPNSHISMEVLFGQVEQGRSEKIISLDKNYAIDICYKIKGMKKPFCLKSIITYNNSNIVNNKLVLKNLSMNIERDKYVNKLGKIYRSSYQGITHFHFSNLFYNIKYFFYSSPRRYFIGLFETLMFMFKYIITNFIAFIVSKKIIIKEGKIVRQRKFSFGNKDHRSLTEKTMNNISKHIKKIIDTINDGIKDEDKIYFSSQENDFILRRFGEEIKIYIPGDSSIYAQVLENENTINIHYTIKNSRWGIKYWTCNNRFITPYNMAIKILNYFILHTLVRR
jgi:hypothetical protein